MFTRKRIAKSLVAAILLMTEMNFAMEPYRPSTQPAKAFIANPLPLNAVRLTGGPLKTAQDLDAAYLLKLEPDRMLAYFRERAGLQPKAKPYGGWDGEGRQLTGHIAGHYLSAVSLMYQATGDERFKQRADYVVAELKEVQEKRGTGYLGAILGDAERRGNASASVKDEKPLLDGEILFDRISKGVIQSGGFDLNGMWAPWYVEHKIFAGLRDAYRYAGNKTALEVEVRFATWAEKVVGNLDDAQAQKMLETEFGGMNETLVDLYADTGDVRWLNLARKFNHKAIVNPLAEGKNILPGKHGNTQIPKLVGSLTEHLFTGDEPAGNAARNFWKFVVHDHSFVSGGHGYDEYFGPPDKLSGQVDGTGQRSRSLRTAESCNVYNMLKLTRRLFALTPDSEFADFQERALLNHVLASIDPKDGRTCYMVPVGSGVAHEYQDLFHSFTCCIGSGMENHALHGEGLYYTAQNRLWINIYAPSVATWSAMDAVLTMETEAPLGNSASLKLSMKQSKQFTISFRRPAWAGNGFALSVNGEPVTNLGKPGEFVDVTREWKDGDAVSIAIPSSLRLERLTDNPSRVAILWGPLVLAGDNGPLGQEKEDAKTRGEVPVFSYADRPLEDWLKPVAGKAGIFQATTADGREITLQPFYTLHNRRYGLYWDLFTPAQWAERKASREAEQQRQQAIAAATIAYVQIGEMQPERDFNFQGQGSSVIRVDDQPGRRGGQWMSVDVPVNPAVPTSIELTLGTAPNAAASLEVEVEGVPLGSPVANVEKDARFSNLRFPVSENALAGRSKVTLRIKAAEGKELPSIFGVRVLRNDPKPAAEEKK